MNETFYTVPEVALILKISRSYAYELVGTGRLESIQLSPRRTRIAKESLDEFIKKELDKPTTNSIFVQPPTRGIKYGNT